MEFKYRETERNRCNERCINNKGEELGESRENDHLREREFGAREKEFNAREA